MRTVSRFDSKSVKKDTSPGYERNGQVISRFPDKDIIVPTWEKGAHFLLRSEGEKDVTHNGGRLAKERQLNPRPRGYGSLFLSLKFNRLSPDDLFSSFFSFPVLRQLRVKQLKLTFLSR